MKWIITSFTAVIVFSAVLASADDFRCPNGNIVSSGDSMSTVEAKCDPPAEKFEDSGPFKYKAADGSTPTVTGFYKVWKYTKGSTLEHLLIFYGGILSEVRTGGFVKQN